MDRLSYFLLTYFLSLLTSRYSSSRYKDILLGQSRSNHPVSYCGRNEKYAIKANENWKDATQLGIGSEVNRMWPILTARIYYYLE